MSHIAAVTTLTGANPLTALTGANPLTTTATGTSQVTSMAS
ncbi:MAG: hypothetical protein NTY36_18035 [Deltaproteobacteria bacterium]|nr:hypothetical protein [Deltaproteobacteria bacterium]